MLKLDNTKRETFVSCPRKYYLRFILGLYPDKGSTALRYGVVWHDVMSTFYSHIKENGWIKDGGAIEAAILAGKKCWDEYTGEKEFYPDYKTFENLCNCFLQYIDHFAGDEGFMEVLETESLFQIKTHWISDEEEKAFPTLQPFLFTGKKDLTVRLNNQPWFLEHKTTGWALSLKKRDLHRSAQVMGYTYAGKEEFYPEEPAGVLVVFHYLNAYKSKTTGEYGKLKVEFERVPQIFTNEDLANWRLSFLDVAERIQQATIRNIWPMGHDSCYRYGRCEFCDICERNVSLEDIASKVPYGYYLDEPWDVTNKGE
jgi:hypothetical protein